MTMRAFTETELSRMQGTQESAMQDRCLLRTRTDGSADAYGYPEATWGTVDVDCGLDDTASPEMLNAEAAWFDATLRLPLGTDIERVDKVQITYRYGVLLATAVEYTVVGEALRGPSGLVVKLKSVV